MHVHKFFIIDAIIWIFVLNLIIRFDKYLCHQEYKVALCEQTDASSI